MVQRKKVNQKKNKQIQILQVDDVVSEYIESSSKDSLRELEKNIHECGRAFYPADEYLLKVLAWIEDDVQKFLDNLLDSIINMMKTQHCLSLQYIQTEIEPKLLSIIEDFKSFSKNIINRIAEEKRVDVSEQISFIEVLFERFVSNTQNKLRVAALSTTPLSETTTIKHAPDHNWVIVGNKKYTFTTARQRQVIKLLLEARERGDSFLTQEYILGELKSERSRLRDTFRHHPAWGEFVISDKSGRIGLKV